MKTTLELKAKIDAHIQSLDFVHRQPSNLYEPIAYILKLKGKRIRPILTLLAYEAVANRPNEEALDLAAAVELFHNFTLMHDDIMDRAPVRRGMPTVHIKWNENIAILSGDALLVIATELVVKGFPERADVLMREFAKVALQVCEGQMEDMDLAERAEVGISEYVEMIRKKTAALVGGCLSLGAIAAGADKDLIEQMRQLGENIGLGFQLQDDLMDAFPPAGFGKQLGGDIIENKKTYLMLKAFERADPAQKERLNSLQKETNHQVKVAEVLEIFRSLKIETLTQHFIHQYFEKARILGADLSKQINFELLRKYLQEIVYRKL